MWSDAAAAPALPSKTVDALLDWVADALEALEAGDRERARRDLNAVHFRLTELGR